MKKIIFFLLISFLGFSQNFESKIDEFTKEKIISCSTFKQGAMIASSIGKEYYISFTCKGKIPEKGVKYIYLNLEIQTPSITCYSNRGGKIVLLLENDTKITLTQITDVKCGTSETIGYNLNENDIYNLMNYSLKKVRIQATDGYMDVTIKDKKQQLIKDTFTKFSMNIQ